MDTYYVTQLLIANVIVMLFWSLYRTMKKEKIMITEEGGEPLPTSSYVFLILNHLIQIALYRIAYEWLLPAQFPTGYWKFMGASLLLIIGVQLTTVILETIIRVITLQIYYTYQRLQMDKQVEEVDNDE